MNDLELAGTGGVVGICIFLFFKGAVELTKAYGEATRKKDKESEQVKTDAQKQVDREKEASHQRLLGDFETLTNELVEVREEQRRSSTEHLECRIQLARIQAWLRHHENALKDAKISFVPFDEDNRTDSGSIITGPRSPVPKKRKRPDDGTKPV